MPAVGRTLAVAVYRPLAEQLVDVAAPQAGETVLELSAGDGELTSRLSGSVNGLATEVVVIDEQQTGRLREALGPTSVELAIASRWTLPFADAAFDMAVSLLAIDSGDGLTATLSEVARVARRAHVAVWDDGATHETALHDAWRDVNGDDTESPAPLTPSTTPPPGWSRSTLSDVARFDGIDQLWLALITEREIDVPADLEQALRTRLAHHVAAFTAADGTMRIPVRATLLTLR